MQWLNVVQQRKRGRKEKKGTIDTLKILPQCKRKKKTPTLTD